MTKKELEQIRYLNKEVKMWQQRLKEIEYDLALQSPNWKSISSASGNITDKTADLVERITETKAIITGKLIEIQAQRKRILEYINSIDDSLIRQIIHYRYISCLKWVEIALYIGGDNTPDGIRKTHDRFIL